MARYSNEFKERAVARLLPPESAEISRVSQEIGVSLATLERWRADALSRPARERAWTAVARLGAMIATAAMDEAQRSAWCREKGVFPSNIEQWRESAMSALALRSNLGISWKVAWLPKHKLMEAMFRREQGRPLRGTVSIDDAYLGGERTGGKVGRGSENKVPFVAAVELTAGRPLRARFDRVSAFSFAALRRRHANALAPDARVTSDGLLGFEILEQDGLAHRVVQPRCKAGTEVEPFRWLNTLLRNLQTALSGTYYAFAFKKYGQRYPADAQYRFNRRLDLKTLPTRLTVALLQTAPCLAWGLRATADVWA